MILTVVLLTMNRMEIDLELGSFCEYLNNTLRYFEFTYRGDTKARRHFTVWEDHFAAIKELGKVFSKYRSRFAHFEIRRPKYIKPRDLSDFRILRTLSQQVRMTKRRKRRWTKL